VAVETRDIEVEHGGVAAQLVVTERPLTREEQRVHVPEPALCRGRLRRCGRGQGVWMDLGEREVAEGEPDPARKAPLEPLDHPERRPRVRALVVPVLQHHPGMRRTADVIDGLVEGRDRMACFTGAGHRLDRLPSFAHDPTASLGAATPSSTRSAPR
jgi:hypothetical protein